MAPPAQSIGQLSARWSGEIIDNLDPALPFVALPVEHQKFGRTIVAAISNQHSALSKRVIAISLGVGGNRNKRISDEFEEQLIHHVLADAKLILDKGASEEEREQINRITARLRAQGKMVIEMNQVNKSTFAGRNLPEADVVTWDGNIGAWAGLIAASDEYIGYDSAGQHIAAALGVPVLTIFVNSCNATFARRWQPFGKGEIMVVNVEAAELVNSPNFAAPVMSQILLSHRRLNASVRGPGCAGV
jgi:ADP-heptose:LPS heptosyltransferase